MSNPWTTGQFTCCTCPEPDGYDAEVDDPLPKYRHRCGCPTALDPECESVEKVAELCGDFEFEDPTADPPVLRSSPPKVYKKIETETVQSFPATVSWNMGIGFYHLYKTESDGGYPTETFTYTASDTIRSRNTDAQTITDFSTKTWDVVSCMSSTLNDDTETDGGDSTTDPIPDIDGYNYQLPPCGVSDPDGQFGAEILANTPDNPPDDVSNIEKVEVEYTFLNNGREVSPWTYTSAKTDTLTYLDEEPFVETDCGTETRTTINRPAIPARYKTTTTTTTLSEEDTEEAALARATETEGTACTSIYELRTTSFSFTVRTVTYTIKASNLQPGVTYEGCVRIQKRKAYSGTIPDDPDTGEEEVIEWEDVEPDSFSGITRTPENTDEDGVTTIEEDVALPGGDEDSSGWEYQALSVHIWPSYADCTCPTDYEEPAPE